MQRNRNQNCFGLLNSNVGIWKAMNQYFQNSEEKQLLAQNSIPSESIIMCESKRKKLGEQQAVFQEISVGYASKNEGIHEIQEIGDPKQERDDRSIQEDTGW